MPNNSDQAMRRSPHNEDDGDSNPRAARLDEAQPTPGSAEGERDPNQQSESNVPRAESSDGHRPGDVPVSATGDR
jgi:hypothetical protein